MVIYLDIVIIENFIINFFLLYLTCKSVKYKPQLLYISISAFIGAIYTITILIKDIHWLTLLPFKLIIAMIMILISIHSFSFINKIKAFIIFLLYSMLLAGVCIFLEINSKENNFFNISITQVKYKTIILSLIILYLLSSITISYIKDRKSIISLLYNVEVKIDNKNKIFMALLDTGNDLREPVTRLPVVIVQKDIFFDININSKELFNIPYKVVDGSGGLLKGFISNSVKIYNGDSTLENEKVVIAICDNILSKNGDYKALLSRGLIENGGKYV